MSLTASVERSDLVDPWVFVVRWWDSPVVLGPDPREDPGGWMEVWAVGADWPEAAANAIRHVRGLGHWVTSVEIVP